MAETPFPTHDDVPTRPDDPRLSNWYHTIELGNGLVSRGFNDHRTIVDLPGIPASLAGKTALDVGTFDGFWAFELERRGAQVTAIDVAKLADFDWLPKIRAGLGAGAERTSNFELARRMRGSKVERRVLSVYDLSPEKTGMFDVVFCGDVLLHLFNPLQALLNIYSVTREVAVVFTSVDVDIERLKSDRPWLSFGLRRFERVLGDHNTYWVFTTRALQEMMEYAGFAVTVPQPLFAIPPTGIPTTSVVGYRDRSAAALAAAAAQAGPPRRRGLRTRIWQAASRARHLGARALRSIVGGPPDPNV